MTPQEILIEAIKKVEKNGYIWSADKGVRYFTNPIGGRLIGCKYYELIFSHSFAKDFWGEGFWQYHLQQMVLEEEPLKYLEKFL